MEILCSVLSRQPLTLHFSLRNPAGEGHPVPVPRLLTPLGAFVRVTVFDAAGDVLYETRAPKLALKLHPDRPGSYLELDPGYTYGVVLALDDVDLADDAARLVVAYSNGPFRGAPGLPVGELSYETTLSLPPAG